MPVTSSPLFVVHFVAEWLFRQTAPRRLLELPSGSGLAPGCFDSGLGTGCPGRSEQRRRGGVRTIRGFVQVPSGRLFACLSSILAPFVDHFGSEALRQGP